MAAAVVKPNGLRSGLLHYDNNNTRAFDTVFMIFFLSRFSSIFFFFYSANKRAPGSMGSYFYFFYTPFAAAADRYLPSLSSTAVFISHRPHKTYNIIIIIIIIIRFSYSWGFPVLRDGYVLHAYYCYPTAVARGFFCPFSHSFLILLLSAHTHTHTHTHAYLFPSFAPTRGNSITRMVTGAHRIVQISPSIHVYRVYR